MPRTGRPAPRRARPGPGIGREMVRSSRAEHCQGMPEGVEVASAVGIVRLAGWPAAEISPFNRSDDRGECIASDVGERNPPQDFPAGQRNRKADAELPADLVQALEQKNVHRLAVLTVAGEIVGFEL